MPGAYAPGTAPPVDGGGDTSAEAAVASTVTCPTCSRNFNATAAARHIKVCEQVFIVKPKKFDGSAKRIEKIAEERHSRLRRPNRHVAVGHDQTTPAREGHLIVDGHGQLSHCSLSLDDTRDRPPSKPPIRFVCDASLDIWSRRT